ncbi:putative porin [Chryseolinea sp. T2]|uniref:putative porin n=1 Tax=Chryseolinea sp. T2 TaxID=3129255 RepID=UPI00307899E3
MAPSSRRTKSTFVNIAALISVLGMLLLSQMVLAQDQPRRRGSKIIDDSTKQVYGPKTSKYYYEKDVYLNRINLHAIDTAIRDFHQFTYVQRGEYKYQDLGNIGTAIRPIFFQMPEQIGATSGFTSLDMYWDVEQMKIYDTKSPYANMHVMLGGKGRSMTRVRFSRNINPRWNFGFTYRALLIDKQIQRQSKGDRNVRSTYYDLFTSYLSKDSSYRVIASFRRNNYDVDENGGVRIVNPDTWTYDSYFSPNAQPTLLNAARNDLRMNIRIYQQYEIARPLQFYNIFERYRQGTEFRDIPSTEPENYYDYTDKSIFINPTDTTQGLSKFRVIRDEVGVKGNLLKLFYQGYYAVRRYKNYNLYAAEDVKGLEHYLGGRMALRLDSLGELSAWAEFQADNRNYRIEGELKSKWFEASLKQMQYSVPLVYQSYRGAHDNWKNDFDAINATQLSGFIHYKSRIFSLSPGVTLTRAGNYVFMKYIGAGSDTTTQTVYPIQSTDEQFIASPEVKFAIKMLKHVHFRGNVIYTTRVSEDDAIQIPEVFINAQLAYENVHYNGNLDIQTGLQFHYQKDYNALGYDVPMGLYYVQKTDVVKGFPLIDVFVSARIKKGKVFFKYNNILQAFTKEGYFLTYGYPGQRNILDFGFDWSFYD